MQIAEIFASSRKFGSRNRIVTSNFIPEVEIWLFRACTMKNMQYNHYYRNSSVTVDLAMGKKPRSTEQLVLK